MTFSNADGLSEQINQFKVCLSSRDTAGKGDVTFHAQSTLKVILLGWCSNWKSLIAKIHAFPKYAQGTH